MSIFNSAVFPRSALCVAACSFIVFAQADTQRMDTPKQAVETKKHHHQLRSVGKIAAPIEFVKPARFRGNSGEVVEVQLNLRASADLVGLSVSVNAESGLELSTNQQNSQFGAIQSGQLVPLRFDVLATSEGLSYVNVICQTESAKGIRMTSYSIPVEIGDISKRSSQISKTKLVEDEQGTMLQVMEARPIEFDTHRQ